MRQALYWFSDNGIIWRTGKPCKNLDGARQYFERRGLKVTSEIKICDSKSPRYDYNLIGRELTDVELLNEAERQEGHAQ